MSNTSKIKFLGVAGYEITTPDNKVIYIDPFLDENPGAPFKSHQIERADLILVSHAAFDHMGNTEEIAKKTGAPVVCGADVKEYLLAKGLPATQIRATIWGIALEVAGIKVQPVECHHWSQIKLPNGHMCTGTPMGFVVYAGDLRFYHYGDTAIFGDLKLIKELYEPNVGCIGIANPQELLPGIKAPGKMLTAEMSPREGALAAEWLGLDVVLPCHYINPDDDDVRAFNAEMDKSRARGAKIGRSLTMKPGDVLVWPNDEHAAAAGKSAPRGAGAATGATNRLR